MALNDILKHKTSAGSPANGDIPNGGFVASDDDNRIYGKVNNTLVPLASKGEVDDKLDKTGGTISGSLTMDNGSADGAEIEFRSLGNVALFMDNHSGRLRVFKSGQELFCITSEGKIGIGTSSPNEELHIVGDMEINGFIRIEESDPRLRFVDTTTNAVSEVDAQSGEGHLYLRVDMDSVMSEPKLLFNIQDSNKGAIDKDGNLGIGTTTPSAKLDVRGEIHAENFKTAEISIANNNIDFILLPEGRYGSFVAVSVNESSAYPTNEYFICHVDCGDSPRLDAIVQHAGWEGINVTDRDAVVADGTNNQHTLIATDSARHGRRIAIINKTGTTRSYQVTFY